MLTVSLVAMLAVKLEGIAGSQTALWGCETRPEGIESAM